MAKSFWPWFSYDTKLVCRLIDEFLRASFSWLKIRIDKTIECLIAFSLLFKGPFQPSYDMMLRFYSLFKQATDGPCKTRRPAFWDVVGRVKYDSWKKLGDMSREKAMESYVNELRQIVETMAYTQNVAEFYNSLNEFDMKIEDIELIAPEVVRSKSEQNSPLHNRAPAVTEETVDIPNGFRNGRSYSSSTEADTSDDEYIDTVDVN